MVSPMLALFDGWGRSTFGRAYRLAIAHAIERDGPIAQFHEVRDLVAPAERGVWEAVDQDDRAFGVSFRQSFEVILIREASAFGLRGGSGGSPSIYI